ncbi:MAG: glutathione S-transferase N-terminal domain-containing protein [Cyanobacteria bacterium J06588_5]
MQLVGMLDYPYVRRVAIALHHYQLPFEHNSLSVFRNVDEFSQINPLVKAPTLVCDNGEVLIDSTLILAYIHRLAAERDSPQDSLIPESFADYRKELRLLGLAINACDKSVQIVYERDLRPAEKQHQPWRDRIQSQVLAAYDLLEPYAANAPDWLISDQLTNADIAVSVAWQFTQFMIPDVVKSDRYSALSALSLRAEALPAFLSAPMEANWQPSQ